MAFDGSSLNPDRAWKVIEDKNNWCQGWFWQNKDGVSLRGRAQATKFCLFGAIAEVYGYTDHDDSISPKSLSPLACAKLNIIQREVGGEICGFNNTHTHEEVIAVLKRLDI